MTLKSLYFRCCRFVTNVEQTSLVYLLFIMQFWQVLLGCVVCAVVNCLLYDNLMILLMGEADITATRCLLRTQDLHEGNLFPKCQLSMLFLLLVVISAVPHV